MKKILLLGALAASLIGCSRENYISLDRDLYETGIDLAHSFQKGFDENEKGVTDEMEDYVEEVCDAAADVGVRYMTKEELGFSDKLADLRFEYEDALIAKPIVLDFTDKSKG